MSDLGDFVSAALCPEHPRCLDTVTASVRFARWELDQLDYVAERLGCSRQVLLARLVSAGLSDLVEVMADHLAENVSADEADDFTAGFAEIAYRASVA